jgi:Zn-dependent M16 (insulinase) family peptidase
MQACENTGSTKVYHTMMETLYDGCGYGFNTGGRVENLRHLTADKVRNYHHSYYRPDNISVIVTGKISPEDVLDSMIEVEDKILRKNINYSQIKPWKSALPTFDQSIVKTVEFPSNEEEGGAIVSMSWRLCEYHDFFTKTAMQILWSYLTDSTVSPVQKAFIETDDPYCGDIHYSINEASTCSHYVSFKNVVTEKADQVKTLFFEVINQIVRDGIDMKRLNSVVKQHRIKDLSEIEQDPHSAFSMQLILDFLYSSNSEQLADSIDAIKYLDMLSDKDNEFWIKLIREHILEKPSCTVVGKPSVALGEKIAEEEAERLREQAEILGEDQLKQLEEELEKAEEINNPPVSEDLLKRYQVPDVNTISFIPVVTYRTDKEPESVEGQQLKQYLEKENAKPHPFFVQYDHILSEFVSITLLMDSGKLSHEQRKYLELYLEVIFEAPQEKDGKIIPHEEVVYLLEDQSVDHSNGCGLSGGNFSCGMFSQLLWLSLKFEKKDYERMIEWMRDIMWNSIFTVERLKISAKKLVNDVARTKRSPNYITRSALKYLNFDRQESNHFAANSIQQYHFLTSILERLESDPQSVLNELNEFRRIIADPANIRIHVTGNIYKQSHTKTALVEKLLPSTLQSQPITDNVAPSAFKLAQHLLSEKAHGTNSGYIFSLASTDSGFLTQSCKGLTDFNTQKRASLLVLIEYFTALEGPFWKRIRGAGLSYNYSVQQNIEEGLMYFVLSQSGSLVKAYIEAKQILQKYLEKKEQFEEVIVEAARSSVISEIIATEETIHMAASNRFTQTLRGSSENANRILLDRIAGVTIDDMMNVLEEYLSKLFDIQHGNMVIVSAPAKVKEIIQQFQEQCSISLQEVDAESFFGNGG